MSVQGFEKVADAKLEAAKEVLRKAHAAKNATPAVAAKAQGWLGKNKGALALGAAGLAGAGFVGREIMKDDSEPVSNIY